MDDLRLMGFKAQTAFFSSMFVPHGIAILSALAEMPPSIV
jgi:hypothetical protein